MVSILRAVIGVALMGLPAWPFAAGINMGGLTPYLQDGQYGYWTLHGEPGAVVLENGQSPGDITYFYVDPEPGEAGRREVSVEVQLLHTSEYSWAGLLYGYRENPPGYYLFVLQASGMVTLVYRDPSGFHTIGSQPVPVDVRDTNTLGIRERGDGIELTVNGRAVGSHRDAGLGRGAVGVAAGDIGAYRFAGFAVAAGDRRAAAAKATGDAGERSVGAAPGGTTPAGKASARTPAADAAPAASDFRYEEERDPQLGLVKRRTPIPADWVKQPESARDGDGERIVYRSADGVVVFAPQNHQSYISSGMPMLDQMARASGKQVAPYQRVDQRLKQTLVPAAEAQGLRLLRSYEVPELLNFHRQEVQDDDWYTQHFETWGADWETPDGGRVLTLAVQLHSRPTARNNGNVGGQAMGLNMLMLRSLEAPAGVFDRAKQAYIASIANTEVNAVWYQRKRREYIARMTGMEAQGRADVARVWSRASQPSSSGKSAGDTYSEISDISHSGYMTRSDVKYAGHQKSVNGVLDRSIISGASGSSYSVPAGSNHYWVNPNTGRYIATDNPLFDPRVNAEIQGQWEPYQVQQ